MSVSSALVTGGAGFVGAAIVHSLASRHPDCQIAIVDRRLPSPEDRLPDVRYYQADVTVPDEVTRVLRWVRPEVVFHTAGVVPPVPRRYTRDDQAQVFRVNVDGTRHVLAASKEVGVKAFVVTSSCTVVTDALDYELPNVDERIPTFRRSLKYGESKAEAERMVLAASDEDMPTCAIRPTITFGPRDPNCLPTVHACISRYETPYIIGTGENLCDFTYIDNIAEAHVLAVENLCSTRTAAGEAFFISNGEPIAFRDFCVAVWAEFGHVPPFQLRVPEGVAWCAGYAAECVAGLTGKPVGLSRGSVYDALRTRYVSIEKARKILGYSPRVGLAEGLHLTCQAYRKDLEDVRNSVQARLVGEYDSRFRQRVTARPKGLIRSLLARALAATDTDLKMKAIARDDTASSDEEYDEKKGIVVRLQTYHGTDDDDMKISDARPWELHASGRFLLRVMLLLLIFVLFT